MPDVYREQRVTKHQLSADDAFLRFLDQMDEQAKLERARNARVIARACIIHSDPRLQRQAAQNVRGVGVSRRSFPQRFQRRAMRISSRGSSWCFVAQNERLPTRMRPPNEAASITFSVT